MFSPIYGVWAGLARHKATPLLLRDDPVEAGELHAMLQAEAPGLPADLQDLVARTLARYSPNACAHSVRMPPPIAG